jgi:hypothetical protein
MANGIYRTAAGKQINMDHLRLQHEKEKAVGNMNANARGDVVTSDGTIIKSRNQRVQEQYKHTPPNNISQIKKG